MVPATTCYYVLHAAACCRCGRHACLHGRGTANTGSLLGPPALPVPHRWFALPVLPLPAAVHPLPLRTLFAV